LFTALRTAGKHERKGTLRLLDTDKTCRLCNRGFKTKCRFELLRSAV